MRYYAGRCPGKPFTFFSVCFLIKAYSWGREIPNCLAALDLFQFDLDRVDSKTSFSNLFLDSLKWFTDRVFSGLFFVTRRLEIK